MFQQTIGNLLFQNKRLAGIATSHRNAEISFVFINRYIPEIRNAIDSAENN